MALSPSCLLANIFVYKLFLSLNISDFSFLLQPSVKIEILSCPPFENLVGDSAQWWWQYTLCSITMIDKTDSSCPTKQEDYWIDPLKTKAPMDWILILKFLSIFFGILTFLQLDLDDFVLRCSILDEWLIYVLKFDDKFYSS